jgi:hypothetical protein
MAADDDAGARARREPAGSTLSDETFPPVSDGDPAANPPVPLDDMPVPPLTEPTDVNGG